MSHDVTDPQGRPRNDWLSTRIGMAAGVTGPEPIQGFMAFNERRNPSCMPEELPTEGRL